MKRAPEIFKKNHEIKYINKIVSRFHEILPAMVNPSLVSIMVKLLSAKVPISWPSDSSLDLSLSGAWKKTREIQFHGIFIAILYYY